MKISEVRLTADKDFPTSMFFSPMVEITWDDNSTSTGFLRLTTFSYQSKQTEVTFYVCDQDAKELFGSVIDEDCYDEDCIVCKTIPIEHEKTYRLKDFL